ncbi:MAG: antibiotic biosynthesis monooxygenase family protein [Planctomycetota bacterium]|jgi:heme-degrading monooxygenase HmoA
MYIAMNRFRIAAGREDEFVRIWRDRDSYLDEVAGFQRFRLLQGERGDSETVIISHSEWESRDHFRGWTESEAFLKAHRQARTPEGLVLGHPDFEGYEVVVS